MAQKIVRLSLLALIVSLSVAPMMVAGWKVKLLNDTPFDLLGKCKKVGITATKWEAVASGKSAALDCLAADCPKGVEIQVTVPGMSKPVNLSTSWAFDCGNVDVRVFLIPIYSGKKITGFNIALGVDVAVSDLVVPA